MLPSGKYPETRSFYLKQFKTVRFLKINLYVDTASFSSAFTEKIYLLRYFAQHTRDLLSACRYETRYDIASAGFPK